MITLLGHIHQLAWYPVKSMAGIATDSALLGWHGLEGDRRYAFRRVGDKSGFPWLSASKFPDLLRYQPIAIDEHAVPMHVRTPDGTILPLGSTDLDNDVSGKLGYALELMQFRQGIFDEASISVINLATVSAIEKEAGLEMDIRRFRANIAIETEATDPFLEDGWIGGSLVFGNMESGPMVNLTMRDLRCMMINLDPDTAKQDPRVMKSVVRLNNNHAGAYGTVVRTGLLRVGQPVWLVDNSEPSSPLSS